MCVSCFDTCPASHHTRNSTRASVALYIALGVCTSLSPSCRHEWSCLFGVAQALNDGLRVVVAAGANLFLVTRLGAITPLGPMAESLTGAFVQPTSLAFTAPCGMSGACYLLP